MMFQIKGHKLFNQSIDEVDWNDILQGKKVNVLYTDPPWGDGLVKMFTTMAEKASGTHLRALSYQECLLEIKKIIDNHVEGFVFVETGVKWIPETLDILRDSLHNIRSFDVKYLSGGIWRPSKIIVGSTSSEYKFIEDLTDRTDLDLVNTAVSHCYFEGGILLDPFCGLGLSARAALLNNMKFIGNELNIKRLEKTLKVLKDYYAKKDN